MSAEEVVHVLNVAAGAGTFDDLIVAFGKRSVGDDVKARAEGLVGSELSIGQGVGASVNKPRKHRRRDITWRIFCLHVRGDMAGYPSGPPVIRFEAGE